MPPEVIPTAPENPENQNISEMPTPATPDASPINDQTITTPPINQDVAPNAPVIVTPEGAGIQIDDVNKSMWQYIRKRKLWEFILLIPFVIVWEVGTIFFFIQYMASSHTSSSGSGKGFGYAIAGPFVLFFSWLYKIKRQFEDAFLEEFALANNYTFDKSGFVDETYGTIFRLKGNQGVSDIITGTYQGNDIRLFLYQLTVGSGRDRTTYTDTVIEIDLHGQLPNLLMVNKKSHHAQLNLEGSFGIKNSFDLEGDFNKYFTLYGLEDNQIEALEVFSPDTMALMEDESKHYTVEFSGNRIYIYAEGFITTTRDITQAFALSKQLITKIAPLASRLQADSAIIAMSNDAITQTRKNTAVVVSGVILIVVLITIITIGIVASYTVVNLSATSIQ